jgi:hypothetical protein
MAIEKDALTTFTSLTRAVPIDDDGYEEGKDKSRELTPKTDAQGNELFSEPPHGRTIEETYPTLFSDTTTSIRGAPHPAGNLKKYNPPK